MQEAITVIKDMYSQFFDGGGYITLFLLSLLYIFIIKKEDNKNIKVFLWSSLILFVIILNPIVYKILEPIFSGGVYWRMFWMLPIAVVICYVATKIISENEKVAEKIIVTVAFLFIIAFSGKFVFTEENFQLATNWYKIPQESLDVATIIEADDCSYKIALVPEDIVAHIRQYDANIILRYGRNVKNYDGEPVVMSLYQGRVEEIIKDCNRYDTNYVVFRNETVLSAVMEDYGYEVIGRTEKYTVYKRLYY